MTQPTTRPENDVSAQTARQAGHGRDAVAEPEPATGSVILEELLIEDVSIDGMCGVY